MCPQLSSIKTIQDKLEDRERVRGRRVVLETCLQCLDRLALAEQVLAPPSPAAAAAAQARLAVLGTSAGSVRATSRGTEGRPRGARTELNYFLK